MGQSVACLGNSVEANTAQQGNWELDMRSNTLTWDEGLYKLYGYEPGEIYLNDEFFILKTTHQSDISRITGIVKYALKNQEQYNFRKRIIKRSGKLGFAETHARIFRNDAGCPIKITGYTFDISGRTLNGVYDFNDPLFFKILYSNYKKTITSEIYKMTSDIEIANDLCQEVFIKVWKSMGQYSEKKAGIYSWLLNITRNHCIDYFRSKYFKVHKITTELDDNIQQKIENSSDNRLFIKELLVQLPCEQRELIDLLFIQGFTQEEIAKRSALPLGTIKTNSRRAIHTLRKLAGITVSAR